MRQDVARAHKGWALDQVMIHNDVLKLAREEIKASPNVSKVVVLCSNCNNSQTI